MQLLLWFDNEDLEISFSANPHVCVRYITPSMSDDEIRSIKKYPFICKTELKVELYDKIKENIYTFTVPKGYCYDGATIPKIFWRVIGSNTDNTFLIPALIHDVLCENHEFVNNDREFSTKVFNALLEVEKVPALKRFLMKNSVDFFQRFCGWEN